MPFGDDVAVHKKMFRIIHIMAFRSLQFGRRPLTDAVPDLDFQYWHF